MGKTYETTAITAVIGFDVNVLQAMEVFQTLLLPGDIFCFKYFSVHSKSIEAFNYVANRTQKISEIREMIDGTLQYR